MVKFGKEFRSHIIASWSSSYLNYKGLKHFIKEQSSASLVPADAEHPVIQMGRDELIREFTSRLDKDLKKIYMLFVSSERELYIQLNKRIHIRGNYENLDMKGIYSELDEITRTTRTAYDLSRFIIDNITGFAKILKKFDKNFKNFNTNLLSTWVSDKLESKSSDLLYIFKFKIINEVEAIVEDLKSDLVYYAEKLVEEGPKGKNDQKEGLLSNEGGASPATSLNLYETYNKSDMINSLLNNIESINVKLQARFKEWNHIMKEEENLNHKTASSSNIEKNSEENSEMISKENQANLYLTLFQKMFMALNSTLILPNAYSMIEDDLGADPRFSFFIIAATPLGGIISIMVTKFLLDKTYKLPMIISAILSFGGNLLFIFGIALNSVIFLSLGRLCIGFALNTRVHRKYIIDFIPRKRIGRYFFYFKLCYLLGLGLGPAVTFIVLFTNKIEKKDSKSPFPWNSYTIPSWICVAISVIILLLIIIFYKEPVSKNFKPYAEGQEPTMENTGGSSLLLDSSLTNRDSDALKQINEQLSQFNEQNNFSDTNLVSYSIDNLIEREKQNGGIIPRAFWIIMVLLFISHFIIMSISSNIPLFMDQLFNFPSGQGKGEVEDQRIVDRKNALFIGLGYGLLVPSYFLNYFFSSRTDKRVLIGGYGAATAILGIILCIASYFTHGESTVGAYGVLFIVPIVIVVVYLLSDSLIYFYTKIIPYDYFGCYVTGTTFVQMIRYIGEFCGALVGLYLLTFKDVHDEKFYLFNSTLYVIEGLCLIAMVAIFVSQFDNFKDSPIRRIIRQKNTKKVRRTEF